MIIKIEAVPKLVVEDGVEKVVMGENNQPVWDKERALITTKGGNYRRIVTLTDELAAEVVEDDIPLAEPVVCAGSRAVVKGGAGLRWN